MARWRSQLKGVIPSVTDGLHCGWLPRPVPDVHWRVIPSVTDGLHCGKTPRGEMLILTGVIPSVTDGLHCGALACVTLASHLSGHPVRDGRAPLRLTVAVPDLRSPVTSSRP